MVNATIHSHAPAEAAGSPAANGLAATLRRLGGLAHQLQAATRAADHFLAQPEDDDRNTGSWLIACAVELAAEVARELDGIGRSLRQATDEAPALNHVQALRKRAHQLHAAARAADHFIDQDHLVDRETGSWLIACAMGLSEKLACALDEGMAPRTMGSAQTVVDSQDAALMRRVAAAMPARGNG